jgi:hypothetical protein
MTIIQPGDGSIHMPEDKQPFSKLSWAASRLKNYLSVKKQSKKRYPSPQNLEKSKKKGSDQNAGK